MKKNLIIWDFDGVIADTEIVWLKLRLAAVNKKFNLNYDIQSFFKIFGGTNDSLKKQILENNGYKTEQKFWDDLFAKDIEYIKENGIRLTSGIEDIFKSNEFAECIATSGGKFKTDIKISACNIRKYFPENNVFTADNVCVAKPEPDLFLYAAQKMGEKPENCIVIEDSIAGMTAALKAGMDTVAFLGCDIYHNDIYLQQVKELGITKICYTMAEIKKYL